MLDKLVDFLISCIDLLRFFQVVRPYEGGVQLRLGKFHRVLECGFYFIIPFGIDHCLLTNIVPTTHSLGDESSTTKDGKSIGFSAVLTYQIQDVKKALLEVEDCDHAVRDACVGEIGKALRESTWEDIVQSKCFESLLTVCRRKARKYGIEILAVQLAGISLARSIRLMQK